MTYCLTCGVRPPHHWEGCPEDETAVGMPDRPTPVAEREAS